MENDDPRKGKVTEEHLQEAAKLKALWEANRPIRQAAGYGSQEAFGDKFNIGNQSAVGFFINGKTALSLKAAIGFAKGLGCAIDDFSPRLAAQLREGVIADLDAEDVSPEAKLFAHYFDQLDGETRRQALPDLIKTVTRLLPDPSGGPGLASSARIAQQSLRQRTPSAARGAAPGLPPTPQKAATALPSTEPLKG